MPCGYTWFHNGSRNITESHGNINPSTLGGDMAGVPIFSVGAGGKQAAQREDGQWFYRLRRVASLRGSMGWSRWLPCDGRPECAWYDPQAGRARLPKD